jgi:hypoxanthine-guanine phosphoribosyltransferase
MKRQITEVSDYINEDVQSKLSLLAGVNEDSYEFSERGIRFTFENSLQANQCQLIKYHDKYIVEFRKKTDNLLEGKMDVLVFEDVIDPRKFQEIFENVTGIYLSFMGL